MCSTTPQSLVTRLGDCVQNKTERKLDSLRAFYSDVLLLTTAYSAYAMHFFLGQFPKYGIDVVVVVTFILFTELLYFCDCVTLVVTCITQFLTGCLCTFNYMSKLTIYYNPIAKNYYSQAQLPTRTTCGSIGKLSSNVKNVF